MKFCHCVGIFWHQDVPWHLKVWFFGYPRGKKDAAGLVQKCVGCPSCGRGSIDFDVLFLLKVVSLWRKTIVGCCWIWATSTAKWDVSNSELCGFNMLWEGQTWHFGSVCFHETKPFSAVGRSWILMKFNNPGGCGARSQWPKPYKSFVLWWI